MPEKHTAQTLFLVLCLVVAGCAKRVNAAPPPAVTTIEVVPAVPADRRPLLSAPVNTNPQLPTVRPTGSCKTQNDLPDPVCTPGVTSPLVTQANIQQTICVSGYTAKIRKQYAPVGYTNALKAQQIKEYGYTDTNPSDYEEDHPISL